MSQSKYKCSGKDLKKNDTQRDKTPKKDVELSLEVEMDDEVREIIASPEKCNSTLLDVTVIKPKDLDHLYSSQKTTLSGDEVKKLIASMELENNDKQKLIDKILGSAQSKSSGDYTKKQHVKKGKLDRERISTTDDTNSDHIYLNYKQKSAKKSDIQHIYTTPKTYNDIKSIFTCKNKNKYEQNEKSDRPCLCRNCAIIGVLTDSQKKPFITENLYDPRDLFSKKDSKEYKRKKCVNFKEEDHVECEYYFKHLTAKIRILEERLSIQEEKSVPRDYFKRIITKLVTHLGKLTNISHNDSSYTHHKTREPYKAKDRYYDSRYYVHSMMVDQKPGQIEKDLEFEEFLQPGHFCPHGKPQHTSESFWKWGEEILRPGIDLKNKIVMLLEDTLHNLKKSRYIPSKLEESEKFLGSSFETPQKHPDEVPVRDVPNKKISYPSKISPTNHNNTSGSTLSRTQNCKSCEKRMRERKKPDPLYEEDMDVSYMNPQMWKWQEESQISFKLDSSDMDSMKQSDQRRLNETHKAEFRETLCNTKESDKLKLWHTICTQAKINGQSRDDKVTIQIPDKKNMKSNRTIEIEYTIAELESLLAGGGHSNQKYSSKKRSERK